MSSLAVVPEEDLRSCLQITGDDDDQVFIAGQWVQISRGLHRGDIGLVIDAYHEEDSTKGVKVMVVPRLGLTDEDRPSSSSKRKLTTRPPPQLFDPLKCTYNSLVRHGEKHIYTYKSWKFENGLQVKFYNPQSLSPAREIPASLFRLFMESNDMAGSEDEVFEASSMPWPSFWLFVPGDRVIIHSEDGKKCGTVLTTPDCSSRYPGCEVNVDNEGLHHVLLRHLEKNVILGEFVEVLAGVHIGKKGFVAAKVDALLGICLGQRTSGVDFWVHVNSVKLSAPDYFNTEIPWLNVEVQLRSGPYAGWTGFVQDVAVNSARSLSITVRLPQGQICTVGYHAIRERWTQRLLLDHQPLKRHQQQFNVEVPWKEVEVLIQSGHFLGCRGIVKNIRVDFRGSLCLSLWVPDYNCSIDIDHSAVVERQTNQPLLDYRPLEGNELREFSPIPWLGLLVDFVKGEYKGQYGAVKDVNRYQANPDLAGKRSGLVLTVERYVFTPNPSSKLVKVDYDAVRTKYCLCDVFMPTVRQSFYLPHHDYERLLPTPFDLPPSTGADTGSSTPLPSDLEKETMFTGIWSPGCPTPRPSPSPAQEISPIASGYETPPQSSPVPWTPASPSPSPPSRAPSPVAAPLAHWILHPNLVGIPIQVDINGGKLDTSWKKGGIYVETVIGQEGISVIFRRSSAKIVFVPYESVVSFNERPKPATEKGLMVVARNNPEHIGKLVRRVHHLYVGQKNEDNHWVMLLTVDCSGPQEAKGAEFLELHPNDLEFVRENPDERRYSTELLRDVRKEFTHCPAVLKPSMSL
ncbi:hypothetical protein GYMLUDRAFT_61807 [Collybiopsis luxurians FD-317 M1]|uniref:Chromatin elongation factor spt5 n=1 Tax=Collybiopsis luxurians FD-317 M1 TaxID=944289 RepID=A0A0D0B109_9AGAR|nr:hypothetical protein GYMLUDRAFT_61807 [Collybiopsis luxurians FD-317 M1]